MISSGSSKFNNLILSDSLNSISNDISNFNILSPKNTALDGIILSEKSPKYIFNNNYKLDSRNQRNLPFSKP